MWLLSLESLASLMWVLALVASFVLAVLAAVLRDFGDGLFGFGLAWGIAIAVVATIQMSVALALQYSYDPTSARALLLGALYPIGFWLISACAALHSQAIALLRGPRQQRVVWNIPREQLAAEHESAQGTPTGAQGDPG
jgi:poly-beta-1,6-N-acetyl-D-glucosamine synthase